MLAILAAAIQVATPAPEAALPPAAMATLPPPRALTAARELVEAGTLATLWPMIVQGDLDALVEERPNFTPEQQQALRATGDAIAARRRERVMQMMAMSYARRLSQADLDTLVAASRTPAARAKRAVDLQATMMAVLAMGPVDLKRETAAQFCTERKLFCDRQGLIPSP